MKTNLKMIAAGAGLLLAVKANAQWTTAGGPTTCNNSTYTRVGISDGTTYTPAERFQVKNGNVLFEGTTAGAFGSLGAGTRLMWWANKGSFRCGNVSSTQWDDANIGQYSFATGNNTTASGARAFASGQTTTASGIYSWAGGISSIASSNVTFAFGNSSTASGVNSVALGYSNTASGSNSIAIGYSTTASGANSVALSTQTTASSAYSTVVGRFNIIPGTVDPSGWTLTDPLFVIGNGTTTALRSNAMTVLKNGNVGIGTTLTNNPNNYLLAVNGTIGCKEVKVEVSSTTWADYVFADDYKLMSLADLEKFIYKEKHLPEMPTTADVEKGNGVNVGEMTTKLLKKVEELSLYVIDLEKKNAELNEKVEKLSK